MDSFELNKMIGALLAVVFIVFSVSILSDTIFAAHAPENPGYIIEAAEVEAGGDDAGAEEVDVIAMLPEADPARGEAAFRKCQACHTVDEGGANRVGPNLWDVVNRPIATHEGFSYSGALREFSQGGAEVWDFDHLSGFLRAPRAYVPGTAMAFAGIRDPQEEADLIVYLRSLSDDPAPLPEVAAAEEPAEGGEAAPAEDGAAPAEEEAAPAEDGAAPAEEGAAPPAGEEAAPAEEEAAPAEEEAAPAEDGAGVETEAAPVEPTPETDGSEASPETDAGTPAPAEAAPAEDEIIEQ